MMTEVRSVPDQSERRELKSCRYIAIDILTFLCRFLLCLSLLSRSVCVSWVKEEGGGM